MMHRVRCYRAYLLDRRRENSHMQALAASETSCWQCEICRRSNHAVPVLRRHIGGRSVQIPAISEAISHCRNVMIVTPPSAMLASCEAGNASCKTSPAARLPPAPASVQPVCEPAVAVTVPSAVVEPPDILFTVMTAAPVDAVPAKYRVP